MTPFIPEVMGVYPALAKPVLDRVRDRSDFLSLALAGGTAEMDWHPFGCSRPVTVFWESLSSSSFDSKLGT